MGDEGYKFIEEKITHKKPNKIFRYIKKFAFIAAGAAVFGIVAAIFFHLEKTKCRMIQKKRRFMCRLLKKRRRPSLPRVILLIMPVMNME